MVLWKLPIPLFTKSLIKLSERRFTYLTMMLLMLLAPAVQAQMKTHRIGLIGGYSYMYPKEWDKIVQTYNWARPWLSNKQPLLASGFTAGIVYAYDATKGFRFTQELKFSKYTSIAANDNYNLSLTTNFARYSIGFEVYPFIIANNNVEPWKRYFFIGLSPGASFMWGGMKFNEEVLELDREPYRPLNITPTIGAYTGYKFDVNHKFSIIPVIGMTFLPIARMKDFDIALHGTSLPELKTQTLMFDVFAGFKCYYDLHKFRFWYKKH